jgi:hypothetical protein
MTYFHYYATTTRALADFFKYGLFPITQLSASIVANKCFKLTGDKRDAAAAEVARWVNAGAYAAITSTFFGMESDMIDSNGREAVSAEMGVDAKKLKFSDFSKSDNRIISKAYDDIMRLQKYRYGTDAMFLAPVALRYASTAMGKDWVRFRTVRDHPDQYSAARHIVNGHNTWDYGVYAGKAAYWAGETYAIAKTSHYEVVKLRENLEATGKDMSANDLLAVYQRTRTDNNQPMIETKQEYDALRPLLKRMAEEYNKHEKFGIPEIVYLIGLGKVSIHAEDHRTVSAEAIERSVAAIDKVAEIGLDGIREENKARHAKEGAVLKRSRSFTDRVADGAFEASKSILSKVAGNGQHIKPEEYVSVRNPGELASFNLGANR